MSRKLVSRGITTPKPGYNNLPPLSKSRGQSETPTNLGSELNVYSYINDNSFNLNTVRKFFTPTNGPKTADPIIFQLDPDSQMDSSGKMTSDSSN